MKPERPRPVIDPSPELVARLERTWGAPRRGGRLAPRTTPNVVTVTAEEAKDA